MKKTRTTGITILGIIDIIIGIVGLPFLMYGLWSFFGGILNIFGNGLMYLIFSIPFILGGTTGLISIMSGIWKLKLKEKGRRLNIYLSPLVAVAAYFGFYFIIFGITLSYLLTNIFCLLISVSFFILCIWYLTRSNIKEQFN